VTSLPAGIDSVADLPRITEALYERGYTREQIHKISGGNFLRAMREVENVSHQIQAERHVSDTLSFEDIELMIGNRVSTGHLIEQINQYGVNFDLTPERRDRIKSEIADEQAASSVVDAISKSRRK